MHSRTLRAAMLAVGNMTTALVSIASLALLVRILPVAEYATYRQVQLTYVFIAPFLTFGMPEALYFFLPGTNRARSILVENLLVVGAAGALVGAFLLLGGVNIVAGFIGNRNAADGLAIMAAYPLLTLPTGAINACLVSRGRTAQAAAYSVTSRLFFLVAIVAGCLVWRSANAALVANVLAAALALPVGLLLVLLACPGEARPSLRGAFRQVRYALPVGVTTVLAATSASVDKVIVAAMSSADDFAVYVNGAMEIPLIGVLTGSAMAVLLPEMSRLWKEGRGREALAMWQRTATKTALGLFPAFCALMVLAPEVITILYSPRYAASVSVFRIWLLLLPLRVVFFGAALMAAGKTRLLLLTSSIGLVANVGLSVSLVRLIGYHGAAWATVGSLYLFQIAVTFHFIRRTYGVPYFAVLPYRKLGWVAGLCGMAAIVLVPALAGVPRSPFVRLVLFGAAYVAAVGFAFTAGGVLDVATLWEALRARLAGASRVPLAQAQQCPQQRSGNEET